MSVGNRRISADPDFTSLDKRLQLMTLFRFGMIVSIIFYPKIFPSQMEPTSRLAGFLVAYGSLLIFFELARFASQRVESVCANVMILIDGLFIAVVIERTGSINSDYLILCYLEISVVSLLLSYKTGVKAMTWNCLLLLALYFDQRAQTLSLLLGKPSSASLASDSVWLLRITTLVITSSVTEMFSAFGERELRRRKRNAVNLTKIVTELEHRQHPNEISGGLVRSVVHSLGFSRSCVLMTPPTQTHWLMNDMGSILLFDSDFAQDHLVTDLEASPYVLKRELDAIDNPNFYALMSRAKNVVAVSLRSRDVVYGILVAEWHPRKKTIPFNTLETLLQLCRHVGVSMQNAELLMEVERSATTDPLTELANRRRLDETLSLEKAHAERSGEKLPVAMIDIDHFKKVNDSFGHPVGDKVLQQVATAVRNTCRESDLAARFGGEELCIVMPDCSTEEAIIATERVRKAIHEHTNAANVTASAGIATFPDDAKSVTELITAADQALYKAKQSGRNRTTTTQDTN